MVSIFGVWADPWWRGFLTAMICILIFEVVFGLSRWAWCTWRRRQARTRSQMRARRAVGIDG